MEPIFAVFAWLSWCTPLLDRSNSYFTSYQFIVAKLSFFYTNVSSLDHMRLSDSCHFARSPLDTSSIYSTIVCGFSQLFRPVLTRFEPRRACSKRRSLTDIAGGATLERPSAKIRSRNLCLPRKLGKSPGESPNNCSRIT